MAAMPTKNPAVMPCINSSFELGTTGGTGCLAFDFQSRPVGGHTSLMAPFSYNYGSRTLFLITNMAGLNLLKVFLKEQSDYL